MDLILVPQKPEDNILPLSYIHKDRLSVKFTDSLGRNCVASAKQIHPNLSKSIVLELDYIAKTYDTEIEIIIGALYYCNDRYINSIVLS